MSDTLAELNASLIGRYLVEKEIGQGGMATVYLARDVRHDRRVAIKVLHPELAAVLGPERFVTEMKVTANLQHPHILPLFDSGTARGQLFYVMPFVEGETLRDKITREQQLPIDEAIRITTEVAGALDYAHRHGVVHRDIKPENILLHDGTALVADFGIALAVSNAGGARLTQTGLSLGTPQYMSPEQATGDRNIDGRTDVYSLGCVMYEMLSGEPPFSGPSAQAIVARVLTESARPIRARRDTVSPALEAAVLKAVQRLPADRFAAPGAFAEALRGGDRIAMPTSVSGGMQATRWFDSRGTRWVTALGACAVVSALAFTLGRHGASGGMGQTPAYTGERLGGPLVAFIPRISPDGKTVAFAGMVNHQSQVGVLNAASGDWKILTHDSTHGIAQALAWSPDGTRIYYERYFEIPRGVYSISPLGGDERLILADAGGPQPLPDGSILLWRINGDRRPQLFRYWPQNGKFDTLPAIATVGMNGKLVDLLPGGREAVFASGVGQDGLIDSLFALDLQTKKTRVISADAQAIAKSGAFGVSADGRSVLVVEQVGDESHIVAIPSNGAGGRSTLVTLTGQTYGVDVGPDGSIYVDQYNRPMEVLHYTPGTGKIEREPTLPGMAVFLPLADGRILTSQRAGGRTRPMVITPGKDPVAFLSTDEPTDSVFAPLGSDRIMLRTGGKDRALTIAYAATGQIAAKIPGFDHASFAGSPDGKTIYYADSNAIWAMPSTGGAAKRLHDGDDVAVDPHGQYLVIQTIGKDGVHLVHFPLDGSPAHDIPIRGSLPLSPLPLLPNAVGTDGRILIDVVSPASWFWPAAILDPKTGAVSILPTGLGYDMEPGWSPDGRVVTPAQGLEATMWRFRPAARTGKP